MGDGAKKKKKPIYRIMTAYIGIDLAVVFLTTTFLGSLFSLSGWMENEKIEAAQEVIFYVHSIEPGNLIRLYNEVGKFYEEIADEYTDADMTLGFGSQKVREDFLSKASYIMDEDYTDYQQKLDMLRVVSDADNIAFFFIDEKRDRIVYVLDGNNEEYLHYPGQWMPRKDTDFPTGEYLDKEYYSMWDFDMRRSEKGEWTKTVYIPIKYGEIEVKGYCLYDVKTYDVMNNILLYLFMDVIATAFLIVIIGIVIMKMIHNRFLEPILKIAAATDVFSGLDSRELMSGSRVFSNLTIKENAPSELFTLLEGMQNLEESVGKSLVEINQMTQERERLQTELSFASQIQKAMLPKLTEEFTGGNRFGLYATMRTARSVGGDFYDFFMLDKDRLVFLVADVSDKGMGAALFMAVSKTIISTRALSGGTPVQILRDADAILSSGNEESMFVTVFMAILDLSTGVVTACNAGHDYPFVCIKKEDGRSEYEFLKEDHGSPLAFFSGFDHNPAEFPTLEWHLSPGDRIFLYTDGVNEAQGKGGDEFLGTDRVKDVLNLHKNDDDKALCDAVMKEIDTFTEGEPQSDDITMLSVTYL